MPIRRELPILIAASLLFLSVLAAARETAEKYVVSPAASKIKVDGSLDEEAWQKAAVIKLPYEWTPGDNTPAPVETECLVTFDRSAFYIAFRCFDPKPGEIRAHLMDRDAIDTFIQDDHISVIIDCFNDERRGFQFRVNPLGVQADANFSELEGYEDFSWDAIWSSSGKITEWGYAIEIAIPFNQLRFPRGPEAQTWGFSAERSWPRSVRHRMESHRRDRDSACLLCQFNKISGLEGISPGRNLEFDPTLTSSRTDTMDMADFPSGGLDKGPAKTELGITAKWGVTPNMILNAAVNPDFSQVEADVAQLNVNERFALFYPEKRPFFLEGGDFFLTPIQAVFTRTVADPLWGAKLTGKAGRSALGFFSAQDSINNLIFPSNQSSASTSLDQDVTGGVLRYRYDLGKGSTLGALYTGRMGSDYANHVGGADGFIRFSPSTNIRFQYLHSETEYPAAVARDFGQKQGMFGGDSYYAEFDYLGRNWWAIAAYIDAGPDFRADYGFVPRVDCRTADGQVRRLFWGDGKSWFTQLQLLLRGVYTVDYSGRVTDSRLALGGIYQGPLQSQVQIVGRLNKEYYLGTTYDVSDLIFVLALKPAGGLNFRLEGTAGKAIDYNNVRPGEMLQLGPFMELGLGKHINLTFNHSLERLESSGLRTYTANLSQVRLIYNFSVRTFIRAIVQYLDVDRVPERYVYPVPPQTKGLFTQFLFSYKINPQTVLFLGYSDNSLGLQGIDLTRIDRTFFLKIGYAFVL
jgi:Domain of unknown function (DUF5916)/Carbohydrate family 9 binding domain-like